MTKSRQPTVSIILATHNRRAVVCDTLSRLASRGLDRKTYELIVVDNASTDGTPGAIAANVDLLIPLDRNHGSCAKSYGVDRARGRYILFLDDDSCPRAGSVERMIERFDAAPDLAAAGFTVFLPSGRREGAALPHVFVGCGVGLRAEALRSVGGLDRSFFMQAEEYDLCFRLVQAGWQSEVFDDLYVDHLKTQHARRTERTIFYDVRNNLRIAARYLPAPYHRVYAEDWRLRYQWLAQIDGHDEAFARGLAAARRRRALDRVLFKPRRLGKDALENFFRFDKIRQHMTDLSRSGMRRIVLADFGKNLYAFHKAAAEVGVAVATIADDRFCSAGRVYRDVPIVPVAEALRADFDAVVVAQCGVVQAESTYQRLRQQTGAPIHSWFTGAPQSHASSARSTNARPITKETQDAQPCAVEA